MAKVGQVSLPDKHGDIPMTKNITLKLADDLYEHIQQTAAFLQRPIDELLIEAIITALPLLKSLSDETERDMASLALLNNDALLKVAQGTLSAESQAYLDSLIEESEHGTLTEEGKQILENLLASYGRMLFTRSHAIMLLRQRDDGHH